MVDIRQMRYFVAVAETLHFGRAAERLHMSQPPLSRQIAALEKELGARLIERDTRQASLTFAGRRFLEDARAVIASFDQACRNARSAERGERGALSVGFMMHAANTVVPILARRFMEAYPEVELELREVVPADLADAILNGRFDAAVMFDPGFTRGLESMTIYREPLCLAAHPDHELSKLASVAASDLEGQPFIVTPMDVAPMLREAVVNFCHTAGFEPAFRLEVQLQQTIVSLVAENLGVALVPQSMRKTNPKVTFLDVDGAPWVQQVLAWRSGNLNPTLGPFIEQARQESGQSARRI